VGRASRGKNCQGEERDRELFSCQNILKKRSCVVGGGGEGGGGMVGSKVGRGGGMGGGGGGRGEGRERA